MSRKSQSDAARLTRRTFAAGVGAAGFVAGAAPFNILRAQGAPLKVGVLLPRSGLQAGIGQDCQRGANIAPAILKSMGLPELSLMNADTETNVDTARARAEQRYATIFNASWCAISKRAAAPTSANATPGVLIADARAAS